MALTSLPDRRLVDVNDAWLNVLGYSRDEVIGKTTSELDLFVHAGQLKAVAERLQSEGRITDCELQVRHTDGSIRHGLFSGDVISSQGKQYSQTVMIDITKRKQAEAQLRLQALVLDQIADRVTVTDLDGIITYVNDAEVRALGNPCEELIGASVEKYGEDPERGATQREIVKETLRNGHWRDVVVNKTSDGREAIKRLPDAGSARRTGKSGCVVRDRHRHHRAQTRGTDAAGERETRRPPAGCNYPTSA